MPEDNDVKMREIDHHLRAALRDFLVFEERAGGADSDPAVRAAQFNEYVARHYAVIREKATPDLCETYLQRYKYLTLPLDEEPDEALTPKKRHAQACIAYSDFRWDVGFKGSRDAESLAFHNYVQVKYPNSLPDFTEGEAAATIAACKSKNTSTVLAIVLGLVCTVGLAGIFMKAPEPETPRTPNKPRLREKEKPPQIGPRDPGGPLWIAPADDIQWRDRIADPALRKQMEEEWRKGLDGQDDQRRGHQK